MNPPPGEMLAVPERLVVAPLVGIFRRAAGLGQTKHGDSVNQGDVIGTVHSLGRSTPIPSPFRGTLIEVLAIDGERVRPGQPVAWLRVA